MDDMVKSLSELGEPQRREMVKTRLATFASMPDQERANSMKAMIGSVHKLDQESVKKLTYTRLESLAEDFDDPTRKKLIGTHMSVLMSLPKEQMMGEIGAMVSVMGQCHEACRMKNVNAMKQLMMEMPEPKRSMMMKMMKDMGMSMEMSASPPSQQVQLAQERPSQNPILRLMMFYDTF